MSKSNLVSRVSLLLSRQDAKYLGLNVRRLHVQNLKSTCSVVAPAGPVVSITTFGHRLNSAYIALESIAAGTVLPSRFILWIDDKKSLDNLPDSIRRLEQRGLEVRLSENYGPHTKYYPYLLETKIFDTPLVTADDDVLYSGWWLEGLASAYYQNPEVVNCYRAHDTKIEDGRIAPYRTWGPCYSTEPNPCHFATGVSGCIYPTALLARLKNAGLGFLEGCPRADDIWLHVNALRSGILVKQMRERGIRFPLIPGTQGCGLYHNNVVLSGNDDQIRNTYTAEDILLLSASQCMV